MLSKAYLLAKIRFGTAENEPAKKLQTNYKFANFATLANQVIHRRTSSSRAAPGRVLHQGLVGCGGGALPLVPAAMYLGLSIKSAENC